MKYVITQPKKLRGHPVAPKSIVLFSENLVHSDLIPKDHEAVSAGFLFLTDKGIVCSGDSSSLLVKSNPIKDKALIETWMALGESMLILSSMEYDAA